MSLKELLRNYYENAGQKTTIVLTPDDVKDITLEDILLLYT